MNKYDSGCVMLKFHSFFITIQNAPKYHIRMIRKIYFLIINIVIKVIF